ncbi:MAG: hypothetical protein R2791_03660 [Saprospiraceae bacterium]
MKILLLFVFPLFFMNCNSPDEFPKVITDLGKQKQFNLAKVEVYKLNACCDCTCTGLLYLDSLRVDTINILSLDVKMDTLIINGDTTTYLFAFFSRNPFGEAYPFTSGKIFPECAYYYAIEYIGESITPHKCYIAENAFSIYGIDIIQEELDSSFQVCLTKKSIRINDWLQNHLNTIRTSRR